MGEYGGTRKNHSQPYNLLRASKLSYKIQLVIVLAKLIVSGSFMKSIVIASSALIFLFVVVCSVNAQTPPAETAKTPPKSTSKINVKYDKSKDTTLISLKSMTITAPSQEKSAGSNLPLHQMDFEASFSYKGQFSGPAVDEVLLRFKCVAGTYIFLRGQELIVAIDRQIPGKDRGFSLGMTGYKSLSPKFNSVYEEIMEIKVPVDALKKFAQAEAVEFFFGPVTYKFTPKQQDAWKEMYKFLPEKAPAS